MKNGEVKSNKYCERCSDPKRAQFIYHLGKCPYESPTTLTTKVIDLDKVIPDLVKRGYALKQDAIVIPDTLIGYRKDIMELAGYPIRIITSQYIPKDAIFMISWKDFEREILGKEVLSVKLESRGN